MKTHRHGLTLALACSASLLGACGSGSSVLGIDFGNPTSRATPKALLQPNGFASCEDFRNYYSRSLAQEFLTGFSHSGGCFGCEILVQEAFANDAAAPVAAPAQTPRQVSQTNTQESGVDEADLIETDPSGQWLYLLRTHGRELLVIDTRDLSQPQIRSRVPLSDSRTPRGLFLDEETQRLAVILEPGFYYFDAPAVSRAGASDAAFAPPPDFSRGTEVQFYDVSAPASPLLIDRFVTDGNFVDARRIGSRLHLVTQFGFPYPTDLSNDSDFQRLAYQDYPQAQRDGDQTRIDELAAQIRFRVTAAVAAMSLSDLLPAYSQGDEPEQTLSCNAVQAPQVDTRLGLLQISSIDSDGGNLDILGSINNAWQVYASEDNLYLLQTSGGWWFDPDQRQQTAITRYAIGAGVAQPGAVGLVDGWINNRFSLSEFAGHLRVATTEGRFVGPRRAFAQANHLTVLRASDLEQTGVLPDFVPEEIDPDRGETIRSVRFFGDRGFIVTFLQIDPLFGFDLSDPSNPRLVGQLEIPGFSSYIHPLGSDHLLTIGRGGGDNGIGVGRNFQLQIFDVSNLADLQLLAAHTPELRSDEYAFSLAEHEPLAFTFLPTHSASDPAAGLLSIPAQIGSNDPSRALSGFLAYRIDLASGAGAIAPYARIDHKDQGPGGDRCPPLRSDLPPEGCSSFAPVIYNEPLRSAIYAQGDALNLLTISSAKLNALDASGAVPVDLGSMRLD